MAKKNTVIPTTPVSPVVTPGGVTPVADVTKVFTAAQSAANRVIGAPEQIAPPASTRSSGLTPVWKEALEPLPIGWSFTVTGIGEKSLLQSVMKTAKKNWPERKFKVWIDKKAEENNGVQLLRVGRLEDRPVQEKKTEEKQTVEAAVEQAIPTVQPEVQYTAENPPPGYYYDPVGNQFLPINVTSGVQVQG